MSSEEKRAWIYVVIATVVPVGYFVTILAQLADTDPAQIEYIRPLLIAIGVGIVAGILATIVATGGREERDVRDKQINRFGEYVGFYVVSACTIVPLVLAMARVDYFWIANTLYLANVLAAIVSSIVKIVAYRRGFQP